MEPGRPVQLGRRKWWRASLIRKPAGPGLQRLSMISAIASFRGGVCEKYEQIEVVWHQKAVRSDPRADAARETARP